MGEEKITLTLEPKDKESESLLESVPSMKSIVGADETSYSAGSVIRFGTIWRAWYGTVFHELRIY